MFKFSVTITLIAIALLAGVSVGTQQHWFTSTPSYSIEIVSFLGITMIAIFYFLSKRVGSNSFTQGYLLSIFLKMLTYSAFILLIIFMDRVGAVGNAVLFVASYMLFTAIEVGFLFKAVNR